MKGERAYVKAIQIFTKTWPCLIIFVQDCSYAPVCTVTALETLDLSKMTKQSTIRKRWCYRGTWGAAAIHELAELQRRSHIFLSLWSEPRFLCTVGTFIVFHFTFIFTCFRRATLQQSWFSRGPPLREKIYI